MPFSVCWPTEVCVHDTLFGLHPDMQRICTVEVQPGENATLLCSNFSSFPTHTIWFRLVNQTSPICISSIYNFAQPSVLCNGIEREKIELTSNISTIFLKIKQVDLSDSGLYFCGFYTNGHPVIVNSTYLKVTAIRSNIFTSSTEKSKISQVKSSGFIVIPTMFISTVHSETRQHSSKTMNENSDAMNYAALSFHRKANYRRPVPPRELEMNVVYAATR
ncbi:Bardet-Biedl syndrome 4 protein [Sarotherodon galilaeus]